MKQSGWSENDVLEKAHEIYSGGKSEYFNLMSEWFAVRDQPHYGSHVGGNSGSTVYQRDPARMMQLIPTLSDQILNDLVLFQWGGTQQKKR